MNRLLALLLTTLLGLSSVCHAYTFSQVGVASNFLIDGQRVIFAQADGSLTVLELDSGKVLRREKSRDYSGEFQRIPAGILMLNYGTIALLNPETFAVIWETKFHYEANVTRDSLVSYDGNGLVERRSLSDGAVRWRYELPGALQVVAEGASVLVHGAATYEGQPATVLLDMESGQELWRKVPPPDTLWPEAFFDGNEVFLEQGSYAGTERSKYTVEKMVVWNLQGEELRSIPIEPEMRKQLRWQDRQFELDQKTFYLGRVYPVGWSAPGRRLGPVLYRRSQPEDTWETAYDLGDGYVFVEFARNSDTSKTEIELRSPEGNWRGELPYLHRHGIISAVVRAPGKILIGSNLGHVECVAAATGESLWLYVFPTTRQTMSYSSPYGMPPMMSQAAAIFRQENRNPPKSGLVLTNQSPPQTRVMVDPDPVDPFARLPFLLAFAWGGAVIPALALVLLHVHPRIRQRNLGPVSVLLVALAFFCFMQFGRVSPGSSIALRVAIVAGIVFGTWDAVKCFRRKEVLIGSVLLAIFGGVAWMIFPLLTRL